jgi:crotonobetainyl-CoA:carnitine CoA-transferase CaiB-like acyl-CoA transferase
MPSAETDAPFAPAPLAGVRVVDASTEIAGPYAAKLLADLGADVVKLEPIDGDPLRAWRASVAPSGAPAGALFQFLNASKRAGAADPSSPAAAALVDEADVVVESGQWSTAEIDALVERRPDVVVVSVTPFGRSVSWADRPATEFTLQALCGSTVSRGTVDRSPLYAGGRLGEWITGAYAGVAAIAAIHGGRGERVDVSALECMAVSLGGFGGLYASMLGSRERAASYPGPYRSIETPSIEPTADGLVGFATMTGQQFEDFLLLIEQPELRGDERYAAAPDRSARYDEFSALVHRWTKTRTTDEIIAAASLFRIPVAPVGTPETVATFDQFVDRRVFVENPSGGFLQPRSPFRIAGVAAASPGPAPERPGPDGTAPQRPWPAAARREPRLPAGRPGRPLDGVRVIDFTAFWAGPSCTQMLAALGADVVKVEGLGRPDGMRFTAIRPPSTDQWWEWSPMFHGVNANKRGITLDMGTDEGRALVLDLVEHADAVVENFSPRVLDTFGITWDVVSARNPRALMVRMPAFGLTGPWRDRTGFAQTMEQTSGMAWVSGYADGPPVIPRGACDPLAGMHAAVAFIAALHERDRSGVGRFVEVTMIEAALNAAAEIVVEHSAYGASLRRDGNRGPVAAPQGLYACAGRERWLALAVADDEQWQRCCAVLGATDWAADAALALAAGRRAAHDEIDARLAVLFAERDLDETVEQLCAAGVPAAPVLGPAAVLDLPPFAERGFLERFDHPLVGEHEVIGIPFRFASRPGPWYERPAPTLGQHNHEVLGGVLGLDRDRIAQLETAGVIGERVRGHDDPSVAT